MLINAFKLLVLQVEVIGGADKYQAVCRKCYGGLMVDKENNVPFRDETPPHTIAGKFMDSGIHRTLFPTMHLWKQDLSQVFSGVESWYTQGVCVYKKTSWLEFNI